MKPVKSELLSELEILKNENNALRSLLDNSKHNELNWWIRYNAEILLQISPDEKILTATPSINGLLGYQPDELEGKDLEFLFHHLDLPLIRKAIASSIEDPQKELVIHIRCRHSADEWAWLETTVINQTHNPDIGSVVMILRVLKAAREVHGQGSLPRIQYHDLFRAIADGLLIHTVRGDDTLGSFIVVNDVACKMLGYSREELLQLSPTDVDINIPNIDIHSLVKRMFAGETTLFESIYRRKDGSEFPVEIQSSIFRLEEQLALIIQVRDITKRRSAEQARKEAETNLEKIAANTLDVIWFADTDLLFRYFSPSIKKTLGYEPSELIGRHFLSILTEESVPLAKQGMESIITRIRNHNFQDPDRARIIELEAVRKGGTRVWLDNSVSILFNEEGTISGFVGVSRDISARRETERQMRVKDQALNSLISAVGLADLKGKVIYANPAFLRLWGYESEDEIIGKHLTEFSADNETSLEVFESLRAGGWAHVEKKAVRRDGSSFIFELSANVVRTANGDPICYMASFLDVTERRTALTLLTESEEKFKAITTTAQDAIILIDEHGRINFWNVAAERIFGYKVDEVMGVKMHELLAAEEYLEAAVSGIAGFIKTGCGNAIGKTVELRAKRKNGELFPIELSLSLMQFRGANHAIGILRDITERRKVEEERKKSVELLKESLAEMNRTKQRLEVLRKIDHAIMRSNLNVNPVDEIAMKGIIGMIPCQEILLITFDHEKQEAVIESSMLEGKFSNLPGTRYPLDTFDIEKFKQGVTDFSRISANQTRSKMEELMFEKGYNEVIGLPLMIDNLLSGLFILLARNSGTLTSEHVQIAEDIASQIALNMHQRELNRRLNRYTTDLEKLIQVRTSELQAILDAVPDMMFRLNRQGTFLDSRSSDPKDLLVPRELFLGKNLRDILPPHVAEPAMNAMERAFNTKETVSFEYELMMDDDLRSYEDRIVAISDTEALSIIRDISERKKAERALRWNESLLQKMASSSPLAFFVVDNRNDAILYFNHRFCEIWGINHLERQMKLGEFKNNDIIPECLHVLKDIPAFAESCKPLQDEYNEAVVEDEIPFLDGRTIRRFSAQIRGENNEYYGRLYIFEDITIRINTEQFIRIQRDLASRHSTMTSLDEALSLAMDSLILIEGVDCGGIYVLDHETGNLDLMVHRGLSMAFIDVSSHYSPEAMQTKMVMAGQEMYIDYEKHDITKTDLDKAEGIKFLAVLPMQFEGEILGCINLGSKTNREALSRVQLSLESLAMQIGGTIARINAEVSLKRSQQNFEKLFDTLDDFMFILDSQGNIIMTNPVVKTRLGYTNEELFGMNVLEVHPPARREEAGFIVNEMLAGRALFCPVPLITKDGRLIPVETRVVLGKWDEKDVLFGISRDITERVKAEKELQVRESYLSAIISNYPGMFWMKDIDGKYLFMNKQNELFLKTANNIENLSSFRLSEFDLIPQENASFFKDEDERVINTKLPFIKEESGRIDNQEKWFEVVKFPVMDKNENVIGISGFSTDITERKKNETALKMQSSAFESFARPIIITNPEGHITWGNTAFSTLSGYSQDEYLGKAPGEILKSGMQDEGIYKEFWSTIKNGQVWSGEFINRRKDGSTYPEEEIVTPVLDQENRISAYIAIKIDLTEKKIMEKALRESEARWNFALEGSGDGVWDWNALTNEVFFSSQWKRMLGYKDDDLSGRFSEWEKRIHPDDKESCFDDLGRHFEGKTDVYINEHRMLCKDGSYKWILDRGKMVSINEDGKPLRVIGTHTDITERKNYENALRQGMEKEMELNQMKSKFISVASHEFRTPLATILATSESLMSYRHKMSAQQIDERIGRIKDQVSNLNKIIEEVLSLSKLQARERELQPDLFDLSVLTLSIVEEFRNQAGREVKLEYQSVPENIEVILDRKNIQLIISNLLSNAVKYSLPRRTVNVGLRSDGKNVILTIQDEGIGIPEEEIRHLFTPFFRASNSGNLPGTGLGLNIVKESVERHGGRINVKSRLNEGTLFSVQLPLTISSGKNTKE